MIPKGTHKYAATSSLSYSPSIAEELLSGGNEWINIQDIVKLTFKALFDVVKAQGEAIRDLEQVMPTKASKAELNSSLSTKANISDVSKTLAEVAANIESRTTGEEIKRSLAEKASREELDLLAREMVRKGDIEMVIKNSRELEIDLNRLTSAVDYLQKDLRDKVEGSVFVKQVEDLKATLAQKANLTEVTDAIKRKATKESVASALQKKADKKELDSILSRKVDLTDLQKLVSAVERKVDAGDLEIMQKRLELKLSEIESWSKELSSKITSKDLDIAVSSIAEVQRMEREKMAIDMEKTMNGLRRSVDSCINKAELEDLKATFYKKQEQNNAELNRALETVKAGTVALEKQVSDAMEPELTRLGNVTEFLQEELRRLKDQTRDAVEGKRRENEETQKYLATVTHNMRAQVEDETRSLYKEISAVRRELDTMAQKTFDRKELVALKSSMQQFLEPKADISEVQQAITESQTLVARRITELREELRKDLSTMKEEINKKPTLEYVASAINSKVDQSMLVGAIQEKANASEFELLASKVGILQNEVERKIDRVDFEQHEADNNDQFADIKKDLLLKANIKDVCTLVDIKANAEDVKKNMTEIYMELEKKTSSDDFSSAMADQSLINEALCAENCVGRWMWKSGALKNGYAVPWEAQSVNTCPDNFLWEKDKTSVMAVAGGLYEVKLGFFAQKVDKVQMLVNGEPVKTIGGNGRLEPSASFKSKLSAKSIDGGNATGMAMKWLQKQVARWQISWHCHQGREQGFRTVGIPRLKASQLQESYEGLTNIITKRIEKQLNQSLSLYACYCQKISYFLALFWASSSFLNSSSHCFRFASFSFLNLSSSARSFACISATALAYSLCITILFLSITVLLGLGFCFGILPVFLLSFPLSSICVSSVLPSHPSMFCLGSHFPGGFFIFSGIFTESFCGVSFIWSSIKPGGDSPPLPFAKMNGSFNSSSAVGLSSGFTFKHLFKKAKADGENLSA
eukprot:TRINITY_DN2297_c1_g1_i1.p1 TRINITY_DN2297_c1_g1~~TRINITY_DN2297_c1_g1_i1.p1  ORF type:complete len:983 (-),score=93.89 TRINITY_DN2297_c1_g1_i1:14064-17012(-)